MNRPSPEESPIAALRDEIDEIDDTIHDLLMRRMALANRISEAKRARGATGALLRPAREAAILRRLHGAPRGAVSVPRHRAHLVRDHVGDPLRRGRLRGLGVHGGRSRRGEPLPRPRAGPFRRRDAADHRPDGERRAARRARRQGVDRRAARAGGRDERRRRRERRALVADACRERRREADDRLPPALARRADDTPPARPARSWWP